MNNVFEQIDFGHLKPYLEDDDITDISYDNGGQIHLKTLSKGIFRVENPAINNAFMEKLAFQCSNVMGKTFNMAHPFLDAESAELRLAFVHDSIAQNGIACVVRKTPAKIRLQKEKIVADKYVELDVIDFLEQCVRGHCNIIACGETGSGKTEFIKYLASKIAEDEKIITIEDTLELHLDKIFPHRDIVSMKTNNIASYTDILEACMRQNPKWILLSEVRSAEAVLAVRNSISSGHYILSTIHADKAASIPNRLYSLLETNQDLNQFMSSICRYIQLGVYIRGYTDIYNFDGRCAVIGRQGANCGNVKYFCGKAFMTEHAVVVEANEYNDIGYLSYRMSLMDLGKFQSQSAQPGLSVKTISEIPIEVPNLNIQKKIWKILNNISEKTNNNNHINNNLDYKIV